MSTTGMEGRAQAPQDGDTRPALIPNLQTLQEMMHLLSAQTAPAESQGTSEQLRVQRESPASRWQGPVPLPRLQRGVAHHHTPPSGCGVVELLPQPCGSTEAACTAAN